MSFAGLSIEVSQDLFNNIQRSHHCLNHLLPVCHPLDTLQPRGHNYALPHIYICRWYCGCHCRPICCIRNHSLLTAFIVLSNPLAYYTGWAKKVSLRSLHITSSNTGRFSKFFHCHILQEICNKVIIKYSTTSPQTCCYTNLWNIYVTK